MGVTAYLEVYRTAKLDPGADDGRVLFAAKGCLPAAWFLFFAPADFVKLRSDRDGSEYALLRCPREEGVERAIARVAALRAHASDEMAAQLASFVDVVARSSAARWHDKVRGAKPVLVLNSHRFEATRAQLTACAKWFDDVCAKGPTAQLVKRADEIFDPCDGFEVEDKQLEVADVDVLFGGPGDGVTWQPEAAAPSEPEPSTAGGAASADAVLARVWAKPDDLGVRVQAAAELTALGDVRGEFIKLACNDKLSARDERRHDKLLESSREELGKPFRSVVMFHRGFPLEVEWDATRDAALAGHPAWATVQSVRYSGPAQLLGDAALARVARLHASPELIREIAAGGRPVRFRSICMRTDRDAAAWQALASKEVFPDLVEVVVTDQLAVWLPPAAQELVQQRPELHLHAGSPSLPMRPLAPMTSEEHAQRVARWTTPPPGPFRAGPRYDNTFR